MTIHATSYGGGVQSTALLVLMATGQLGEDWGPGKGIAIFANTGDDSEHPATLAYVRNVAMPYAASHGIELVEVKHATETLYQKTLRQKGVTIPMRLPSGAPANRGCTRDFKIAPINRELKRRGATKANPAIVALGISVDEYQRMKSGGCYPLIERRMDRAACEALIRDEGLPLPGKSACWFCPWTSPARWKVMLKSDAALFNRAVQFERDVNAKGTVTVYLTDAGKPLDIAIVDDGQTSLFDGASCDIGGYCHS